MVPEQVGMLHWSPLPRGPRPQTGPSRYLTKGVVVQSSAPACPSPRPPVAAVGKGHLPPCRKSHQAQARDLPWGLTLAGPMWGTPQKRFLEHKWLLGSIQEN